jgi:starvation-inducible DNA-binding protein
MPMNPTPSRLPETARARVVEALNALLADGADLQTQAKYAHWNLRGPLFGQLHALFDGLAGAAQGFNDEIAERVTTLGGRALGTVRQAAQRSRLPEPAPETSRDLDFARLLSDRVERYLVGTRDARRAAAEAGDEDTVDLLTGVAREMEKQGWFLQATLAG